MEALREWVGQCLSQDAPGDLKEEWVVVGAAGAVVRAEEDLTSPFVDVLPKGTMVVVARLRGNRCLVRTPVRGWASVVAESGKVVLDRHSEPEGLCCPVTTIMYRDPVLVPNSGYTYERQALMTFWQKTKGGSRDQGWPRDPMTNLQLPDTTVHTNIAVRMAVQAWLKRHPECTPDGWTDREVPTRNDVPAAVTSGGRFGGFSVGQRVCAAHSVRGQRKSDPSVSKGELGVFRGPVKPYDRAIAEGLAEVLWDSLAASPLTVPLKDIASIDKRCQILKSQLLHNTQQGIVDEELAGKVEKLAKATQVREELMERMTLCAVHQLSRKGGAGWVVEKRVCMHTLHILEDLHKFQINEPVLGPLHIEGLQRTVKKLAKAGLLEKSTHVFPNRIRGVRLSQTPKNQARIIATAAALLLATLAHCELAAAETAPAAVLDHSAEPAQEASSASSAEPEPSDASRA
eukprot:TRINITY_DN13812_c0_g1_i1.p1 TRINITY_DN13812_c0_g1~~TRINITY_DN13812_c0_g1_i1.p1  ORF type:complete len:496 (+),score=134.21 TRINITY_DN13812_c0_g1_i1:114-1490(+)